MITVAAGLSTIGPVLNCSSFAPCYHGEKLGKVCKPPPFHVPSIYMYTTLCRLHPQTEVLLRALVDREVCSRQALMEQWMTDSTCEWSGCGRPGRNAVHIGALSPLQIY